MTKASLLSIALLPLALAACSMSPPDDGSIPVPVGGSFDSLALEGEHLIESYADNAKTSIDKMPKSGKATYNGVAGFGNSAPDGLLDGVGAVGRITLNADFASNAVTGSIENIRLADNTAVGGVVDITDGAITQNSLAAKLNGNLSYGNETTSVLGTLDGDFVVDGTTEGLGPEAIIGTLEGDFGNTFLGYDVFYGIFGAE